MWRHGTTILAVGTVDTPGWSPHREKVHLSPGTRVNRLPHMEATAAFLVHRRAWVNRLKVRSEPD